MTNVFDCGNVLQNLMHKVKDLHLNKTDEIIFRDIQVQKLHQIRDYIYLYIFCITKACLCILMMLTLTERAFKTVFRMVGL